MRWGAPPRAGTPGSTASMCFGRRAPLRLSDPALSRGRARNASSAAAPRAETYSRPTGS